MSKQTSSGTVKSTSTSTGKGKASTGDGLEGRPTNRPKYQHVARPLISLVSRPTGHLVSRPKGVGASRGAGRGGSGSASGNGDQFANNRGDIGEYINKGNRHVVRLRGIHGGRGGHSSGNGDRFADDQVDIGGGRSSGYGNGDQFIDDRVDIRQDIDDGNRPVVRPRGIHRDIRGSSSAIGEGDRFEDDYAEDLDEGMDELDMEPPPTESSQRKAACCANEAGTPLVDQDFTIIKPYPPVWIDPEDWYDMIDRVSKHTVGSIRTDQHRLRMEKERGGPNKYSDLMEEKYGADRECHPRVGDREI
ncbi:hypothetical protein Tco_1451914 [Tanacetum coccineum]